MSLIPKICGKSRISMPDSGCGETAELEYRIKQLEDWVAYNMIDSDTLEELTPMECYKRPCEEPTVCTAQTCCAVINECSDESEEITPVESTDTEEEEGEVSNV